MTKKKSVTFVAKIRKSNFRFINISPDKYDLSKW